MSYQSVHIKWRSIACVIIYMMMYISIYYMFVHPSAVNYVIFMYQTIYVNACLVHVLINLLPRPVYAPLYL